MKKLASLFVLLLMLTAFTSAQTPMFYNYSTGGGANSFPLGIAAGKMVQWLVLPGEWTGATAGNITKFYFKVATGYPINGATYSQLYIRMGQTTITSLTSGAFYSGTMDTVYSRASVTLTAAADTWLQFVLDHPFVYNPAQGVVIEMGHCGGAGATGFPMSHTTVTGNRRVWSVGGCPFAPYASAGTNVLNCGIDVATGPGPLCFKYSSQWCPANTLPALPTASYFTEAAWIGDTLYAHLPSTSGAPTTTIVRYTVGASSWSTGVPLPVALSGGSLTTCNGKMYYIGGSTTGVSTGGTGVYEYDPTTGAWTTKAPLPAALSAHNSVCWGDSVIFVVGGPYTGAATNLAVHYYRPASNTWGTISNSLPSGQGRRSHALGIVGNKIFMAAGYNTTYLNSFYIGTIGSDATSITWAAGPNVPATLSRVGGVGYNHFFYVAGGEISGGGFSAIAHIYNIASNTWQSVSGKPVGVSNAWCGVVSKCVNDTVRVYVVGGYTGAASNAFDYFGCGPTLVGTTQISTNVPSTYSLSQNYPNPFNPVTKISFDIPKSGLVTLKIYDVLGKEVATLVNETKNAGSYIVDFDASTFASGTYFYRLESNGFVATKKMMLIK